MHVTGANDFVGGAQTITTTHSQKLMRQRSHSLQKTFSNVAATTDNVLVNKQYEQSS